MNNREQSGAKLKKAETDKSSLSYLCIRKEKARNFNSLTGKKYFSDWKKLLTDCLTIKNEEKWE